MEKIQVAYNKTLKLTNICIYPVQAIEIHNLDRIVFQMENYIRSKGAIPIGPLVQFMQTTINENGESNVVIQLLRQVNTYIPHHDPPYVMEQVLRCPNCLFCRFTGEASDIHFAYNKLNLISFEEDIILTGRVFTVFTSKSKDTFTADIFMEAKNS